VFQYCPETGERLISNCGKLLGWTRTVGVEFCEHCLSDENDPTTDLRRATADRLAMRDLRLYSQVAGLIVPRQIRGEEIRHNALGRAKEIGPWLFRVT
jgi:hypothetical protein